MAPTRSVSKILASTSEFLFPADLGTRPVRIESRDADGDTALHVLVWQNDLQGVRALISAGADVNALGDMGYTPLHAAVSQDNAEIVSELLRAGARADLSSELCGSALHMAQSKGGSVAALFGKPDE